MSGKYDLKEWAVWKTLFQKTFQRLVHKNPLVLAGATAFFTLFSAAPILLMLVQLAGLLVGKEETQRQVAKKLAEVLGSQTQSQIIHTLSALHQKARDPVLAIVGVVVLLLLSTNIFNVVNSSLNSLWMVRPSRQLSFWFKVKLRLRYILLIVAAGFLLVLGLAGEALKNVLGKELTESVPLLSFYFRGALHYLFSVIFNIAWFAIVFRYLGDVRPSWKTVFVGAVFTGVLFTIGRLILHSLLVGSDIATLYGASASVVLLLLFVFYSSLILYYGASFTVAWAEQFQHNIEPMPYAQFYTIQVQKGNSQVKDWRLD